MLHAAIEVRSKGDRMQGLFASRPIAAGEVIWAEDPDDPRYHRREIATWSRDEQTFFLRWSYQVDDDWFAGPRRQDEVDDSDYMNHSCDPNCWWRDQSTITTMQDVQAGDELTFDYATSESRPDFRFTCECGTSRCRGEVRGDDYLRVPELRVRYGLNAQPFLRRRVERAIKDAPRNGPATIMLHAAIELRPSPTSGFGLFATRPIAAGEVIWRGDPTRPLLHRDTLASLPPERQRFYNHFAYQVDDDWYSAPLEGEDPDVGDYMNHSCDPTVWFLDAWTMSARRAITAGEEITYDYATSESAPDFLIDPCTCGTRLCRGTIRHTDFLAAPELQERYGDHVLPYLRRRVTAMTVAP